MVRFEGVDLCGKWEIGKAMEVDEMEGRTMRGRMRRFSGNYFWPCAVGVVALTLACGGWARGNGGGYIRGGVVTTGGVAGFEPEATEHVRILEETLLIRAGKERARVEVHYVMRNVTDGPVTVRFGFPLEESMDADFMQEEGDAGAKPHEMPRYCRDYEIRARGLALGVTWQAEENREGDERLQGLSGWNVSEISFAGGEEVPVTICFESDYPGSHQFVSDTSSSSAGIFRYRLSTAACWHGTIGEGRVIIEPDGIDLGDIRVLKPVNRFKKDDERWIWNFEDLAPTLDDDLEIECQPRVNVFGHQALEKERDGGLPSHLYAEYVDRGGRWSMLHSNYEVKASSTLAPGGGYRYDAENVRDLWGENAWSEGVEGKGVGEWLELTPKVGKPLVEIRILPGYQKARDGGGSLFRANARPKTVRVELNGEHRFDAEIPDLEEEVVIPVSGYDEPVERVRLTFIEVYPGDLYEDLCVTAVRLHARLDREPEIQPQR
jgi:hypothetical protein